MQVTGGVRNWSTITLKLIPVRLIPQKEQSMYGQPVLKLRVSHLDYLSLYEICVRRSIAFLDLVQIAELLGSAHLFLPCVLYILGAFCALYAI